MDNEKLFADLHRLLREQEAVIEELISAGDEQTRCLRQNNTADLHTVLQRQSTLSSALGSLEEKRVQAQRNLETALNLPGGGTLRDLLSHAGAGMRPRLEDVGRSLQEKNLRLREINRLNRTLTNQALRFTNVMLDLLRPEAGNTGYEKDGSKKKGAGNKFKLDKSI